MKVVIFDTLYGEIVEKGCLLYSVNQNKDDSLCCSLPVNQQKPVFSCFQTVFITGFKHDGYHDCIVEINDISLMSHSIEEQKAFV